jgi:TRAP-type mannitol/chloroaromatic compound transport system substrate-binding protein
MDRREFLKTTGVAAAAAAAGATGAHAAGEAGAAQTSAGAKLLRMVMPWPDDGKGFGDSARRLARRIEAATGSRCRVELVESTRTGIEVLAAGEAELYHGTEDRHVALHPAFAYFAGLPWERGLPVADLEAWLVAGGGQALWDGLAGKFGVKSLLAGHTGPVSLWSAAPLDRLADLAGLGMSVDGLAAEVVRGIGAEPVALAPGEIVAAMKAGRIGAAQYGGVIAAMSLGLPEIAPRAYALALGGQGTAMSLGVSRALWDSLAEADKAAFASAAREELHTTIAEERAHREPILMAMRRRYGVVEALVGAEVKDATERIGGAVVAHAAGHDADARRINASYMGFAASGAGPSV